MDNKAISSDLIRGHIDTIILHALLNGNKFAGQISEYIEEKSNGEYKINQATLYSSLKRLENLKYISGYWQDAPTGRRRFFRLTELGNQTVSNNLSNWEYSRKIIDKLMDFDYTPSQKIVEKVVYVTTPQQNEKINIENSNFTLQLNSLNSTENDKTKNELKENQISQEKKQNDVEEVNFRNILYGLIKTQNLNNTKNEQILINSNDNPKINQIIDKNVASKHESNEIFLEKDKKIDFNTAVNDSRSNINLKNYDSTGRIDYNQMISTAEKDGMKIKFSTKETKTTTGTTLINKLSVCSAMVVFLLVLLEYLVITINFAQLLKPSAVFILVSLLIFVSFPVLEAIRFFKSPNKMSKTISKDSIITSLIVVFNLLLITFVINLFLGLDFSNLFNSILFFYTPCLLFVNVFIFYLVRFLLSKLPNFNVKK